MRKTVPGHWRDANLLEIAPINSSLVDPRKDEYKEMILIAPDHIESGSGRIVGEVTAADQGSISGKYLTKKNSVIYSKIRPYLRKAAIARRDVLCSADMYPLECTDQIIPEYLLSILLSDRFTLFANSCSNRTGIPKINRDELSQFKFALPSIPEQAAIAFLHSTWDVAIVKTDQLITAKEKQFKSLVKSLITDKCDRWSHLRADKIFKSISEKQNDDEELLSVTQDRGVIPRTMLEGRVMSPESGTDTYKLIKVGDFAISLRSFQGGIEYSRYQGLISPAYTVLRPKLEIDSGFYRHFFKSYLFIEKYLNIAVIGIRDGKQISIPDFMTVKIPLPPIEEQKQIATILTTAQQEIDLLKKQAEAFRRQKRGLMQKLLTGEWRVSTVKEAV